MPSLPFATVVPRLGFLTSDTFHDRLSDYCRKWRVKELALFGSVLREDFRPASDVDVLVTFEPDAQPGYAAVLAMKAELEQIFGRPVDLVDRRAVEESENYIRRRNILNSAVVMHGS